MNGDTDISTPLMVLDCSIDKCFSTTLTLCLTVKSADLDFWIFFLTFVSSLKVDLGI